MYINLPIYSPFIYNLNLEKNRSLLLELFILRFFVKSNKK